MSQAGQSTAASQWNLFMYAAVNTENPLPSCSLLAAIEAAARAVLHVCRRHSRVAGALTATGLALSCCSTAENYPDGPVFESTYAAKKMKRGTHSHCRHCRLLVVPPSPTHFMSWICSLVAGGLGARLRLRGFQHSIDDGFRPRGCCRVQARRASSRSSSSRLCS